VSDSGRKTRKPRWHPWRNLLLALVAVSLYQYLRYDEVSWPVTVVREVGDTLGRYANRPGASWREAAGKLEELGAAREGQPLPAFDLTGRVVRVADGDTLSLLDHNNSQHKIRLHGIDTPEREQRYGKQARDALVALVDGKTVGVVVLGEDSYGRVDGTVYLDKRNINLAMVTAGHAWWYRHYAPDDHLLEMAEAEARSAKRGLWARPDPMPPWEWRREQRYSKP